LKYEKSILGVLMLVAASLAAISAFSFPGIFLCAGIHMKVTEQGIRKEALSCMFFIISFDVPWFCIAIIERWLLRKTLYFLNFVQLVLWLSGSLVLQWLEYN
jgi:hypothetical protein